TKPQPVARLGSNCAPAWRSTSCFVSRPARIRNTASASSWSCRSFLSLPALLLTLTVPRRPCYEKTCPVCLPGHLGPRIVRRRSAHRGQHGPQLHPLEQRRPEGAALGLPRQMGGAVFLPRRLHQRLHHGSPQFPGRHGEV